MSIWKVTPKPNGIERIDEFLKEGFIAIGWPELGNLAGKNRDEISAALVEEYGFEGMKLRNITTVIDNFVNKMAVGDRVVSADGKDIYVGEISSDYTYDESKVEDGDPSRRSVKWLDVDNPIQRDDLPGEMRSSLKGWLAVTNLDSWEANLPLLLEGKPIPVPETAPAEPEEESPAEENVPGYETEAELEVPSNANLLATAKEVLEEELMSDDPNRRLAAAIEVLKFFKQ